MRGSDWLSSFPQAPREGSGFTVDGGEAAAEQRDDDRGRKGPRYYRQTKPFKLEYLRCRTTAG